MAKTIYELIKRNDYVEILPALSARTAELAKFIHKKMDELHENELISFSTGYYKIVGAGSKHYFIYKKEKNTVYSLEHPMEEYVETLCDGTLVMGVTQSMCVCFLEDIPRIIKEIDEIETKKVNRIKKALENVKDI